MAAVDNERTQRAVAALLKWKETQSKSQKPQLLPIDEFIYLILTLKKIPSKGAAGGSRVNPYKIPLPHPLFDSLSAPELCLIIDDRPSSKLTSDMAKKKIKSEEIPVSKVIKLTKLRTDYKSFEAKRKLCDSYDMFFADKRVVPLLPKLLGKHFFKKRRLPVPVDLTHKNWKEQIERVCSSGLLYLRTGTCSVVRVGKVSMAKDEIFENVVAAIDEIAKLIPKKWAGVRSLHLKFSESLALPLYQSLPDMKFRIEGIKENVEGGVEESGGEIVVVKEKNEKLTKKKVSKKGRIHEVEYMDVNVGELELGSEDDRNAGGVELSGNDDLGSAELVTKIKKRKNGDDGKKGVLSELNGGKAAKKKRKSKKEGSAHGEDDDESKQTENEDLASTGKKRSKKDLAKGSEKRVKKMSKKGDGEEKEETKGGLASKGLEDSVGKKGKKKSESGTPKAIGVKVKKSKIGQSPV